MRLFSCQTCNQIVYFENRRCERCAHVLGFDTERLGMTALDATDSDVWTAAGSPGRRFRFCENAALDACNWLVPAASGDRYCAACRHNRTVPDLSAPENIGEWRKMEAAKHRLIYTLMRLGLPLPNRADEPRTGLVFDFLADAPGGQQVLTGHDDGLIVVALKEADDAERERRRAAMGEPYRTLLGHFRHEVGHFYWDRLVRDGGHLVACRAVFGDDEEDYAAALQAHYRSGPPRDWRDHFVSAYATTHAWEDFAETWAHYLHIVDSLDTAAAFGLALHPRAAGAEALDVEVRVESYGAGDFHRMVDAWLPVTLAMNAMNRSMGLGDMYPFVLSEPVIGKLGFIHRLVHGTLSGPGAPAG